MNKNFYSATMLVNFINHKHLIIDEFKEKLLNLKKSEKTVVDNLRIKKGLIHEVNCFKELILKIYFRFLLLNPFEYNQYFFLTPY